MAPARPIASVKATEASANVDARILHEAAAADAARQQVKKYDRAGLTGKSAEHAATDNRPTAGQWRKSVGAIDFGASSIRAATAISTVPTTGFKISGLRPVSCWYPSEAGGSERGSALSQGSAPRGLFERPQLRVPGLPRPFAGLVPDQIAGDAGIFQIVLVHHRQFLTLPVTFAPERSVCAITA